MLYRLVIDLEATTDEGGWPITEMEKITCTAPACGPQGPGAGPLPALSSSRHGVRYDIALPGTDPHNPANIDAAQPLDEVWGIVRALARPTSHAP